MENKNGCLTDTRGTRRWYDKGQLHREDGPALEYHDGSWAWLSRGIVHRIDGPALHKDGVYGWRLYGRELSFDEYCKVTNMSEEDKMWMKIQYGKEPSYK